MIVGVERHLRSICKPERSKTKPGIKYLSTVIFLQGLTGALKGSPGLIGAHYNFAQKMSLAQKTSLGLTKKKLSLTICSPLQHSEDGF